MTLLGDCQLEGLIKTRVEQYPFSHFINTTLLGHTLMSFLSQSPSRIRRISHQIETSAAGEWLKLKLTSPKIEMVLCKFILRNGHNGK